MKTWDSAGMQKLYHEREMDRQDRFCHPEGAQRPKDLFNENWSGNGEVEEILRSTLRMTASAGCIVLVILRERSDRRISSTRTGVATGKVEEILRSTLRMTLLAGYSVLVILRERSDRRISSTRTGVAAGKLEEILRSALRMTRIDGSSIDDADAQDDTFSTLRITLLDAAMSF